MDSIKVLVILTGACTCVCFGLSRSFLEQPITAKPSYRHRARAQRAAAENNSLQFVLFSPRTTSESQHCNVGISDESIELSYRNVSDMYTDNQPWMPLATFPLGGEYLDVCMYKYMYICVR